MPTRIKTRSVVSRSFRAMAWGWVACNLSIIPAAAIVCCVEGRPVSALPEVFVTFTLFSLPVILLAWLFIFLPMDMAVRDDSVLRHPCLAPLLGGISGVTVMTLYAMMDQFLYPGTWWKEAVRNLNDPDSWLYLVGAGTCGLAASLYVALAHPRAEQARSSAPLSNHDPHVL
ncbi:MAG: hypothetical protein V4599_02930 [Verrucomicrobiota bacterium]